MAINLAYDLFPDKDECSGRFEAQRNLISATDVRTDITMKKHDYQILNKT